MNGYTIFFQGGMGTSLTAILNCLLLIVQVTCLPFVALFIEHLLSDENLTVMIDILGFINVIYMYGFLNIIDWY
jgi:hypothetical protein